VQGIVEAEGFKVHPDKTRVMRRSSRQEVTGLTVNEGVAVPRHLLRRYRAVLQQVEKHGPAGRHFGPGKDVVRSLLGFGHFAAMVDPEGGGPLLNRARRLAAGHGATSAAEGASKPNFRKAAAAGLASPGRQWTPAEKPAPALDPVLAAMAREDERKAAAAARQAAARAVEVAAPNTPRQPINAPTPPIPQDRPAATRAGEPWLDAPAGKKGWSLRFTPMRVLVLVLILVVSLAIPGVGPIIGGVLLYFYFRWLRSNS
jgi:RNA-directed DNA polymerase